MPNHQSSSAPLSRGRTAVVLGTLVAIVTLAVFLPSIRNGFVDWDDAENFLNNPHYRGLGAANLRWMFTTMHLGLYIPVTWLTLGLDYVMWGMNPKGYHLTSVLFHTGNAVLFYMVAYRLLDLGFQGRITPLALHLGGAAAALLFSVHPLRVESVAWVTERRDTVSGLFVMLTVLAYLRAVRRGSSGKLHRASYWSAVALFALALLSKPSALALPLVLFALDVYPLRRLTAGTPRLLRRVVKVALVEKAPFLALSAAIGLLTLLTAFREGWISGLQEEGVLQRLAITGYGLAFYLWKSIWPSGLSPLYSLYRPIEPLSARYVLPGTVALLLTVIGVLMFRRWPAGLVAWASYVFLLLPVAGIAPNGLQIAADRYSYLPCLGGAVLAGAGLAWSWDASRSGRISAGIGMAVLGAAVAVGSGLAALTVKQIAVWQDSVALWRQAAEVDVDSDLPVFFLGWALAEQGRVDEARLHFTRSLERVPETLPGLRANFKLHLGLLEERAGNLGEAERNWREALVLDPKHPAAMIRLGLLLLRSGRLTEAAGMFESAVQLAHEWPRYSIPDLSAAVRAVPMDQPEARGRLTLALGILLLRRHMLEAAEAQYRLAVRLLPREPAAWNGLGVTHASRGRYADALQAFARAAEIQPGYADACRNARRAAEMARTSPGLLNGC